MALTSTIYNFEINISNVDRGVYESLKLPLARHPSESMSYMLTRLIAYCLEYREGISFSKGLSDSDEPPVWAHDLTGQLILWVEVGAPSAERLHRASKLGAEVAVYAHKDPELLFSQLSRAEIHRAEAIRMYGLDGKFLEEFGALLEKRSNLSISVSENQLYLSVSGKDLLTPLREYRLGGE